MKACGPMPVNQFRRAGPVISIRAASWRVIHLLRNRKKRPERNSRIMDEFDRYRADMNEKLLGSGHLGIKRFFALDTQAYEDGALDKRTKELMGLTGSI